jgi:hypothetical protein
LSLRLLSTSSGDVPIGPSACAKTLVERVGREIRAAWPDYGASLRVDSDLFEARWGPCLVEHGPAHSREDIDFAGKTIGERKAQHAVTHDGNRCDVWG